MSAAIWAMYQNDCMPLCCIEMRNVGKGVAWNI